MAARTGPQQSRSPEAQASTQEAVAGVRQAAVDQARLNLEYTVVRAPVAGSSDGRSVQLGPERSAGQPLFSIVEV